VCHVGSTKVLSGKQVGHGAFGSGFGNGAIGAHMGVFDIFYL